jgi:mannose-6-phosphate isomerase
MLKEKYSLDIFNQPWKLVPNRIRGSGGREIDKFRGVNPPADDASGSEGWIGSVTRVVNPPPGKPHWGCSEVILPDSRRMYLFEAIALDPQRALGKKHTDIHGVNLGMLVKLLDAQTQYKLQAHPTRAYAKKMWNSDFGKEESWYVIGTRDDVKEPPYILLGFKEGITREKMEELYRKEDMKGMEELCHKITVKTGDVFFVGGGVVHALGEGCFVIEVQEPSDITVVPVKQEKRVQMMKGLVMEDNAAYEEKLLGSFIYNGCNYKENLRRWKISHKTLREGSWGKEYFIIGPDQTSYFSYTRLDVRGKTDIRNTGFPQVAIILNGEGVILCEEGKMPVRKGEELFLPYHIPGAYIEGDLSIVLCHPEGASHSVS